MSDDLDKLAALLREEVPPPRAEAKLAALEAGMAAFEKNSETFQGSADSERPIHNRPQNGRGFLEGFKLMLEKLSPRSLMLGSASFATIALAVVVTQNVDLTAPEPFDLDSNGEVMGVIGSEVDNAPRPVAGDTQIELAENSTMPLAIQDTISSESAQIGDVTANDESLSFTGGATAGYNDDQAAALEAPTELEKDFPINPIIEGSTARLTLGNQSDEKPADYFYADRSGLTADIGDNVDEQFGAFGYENATPPSAPSEGGLATELGNIVAASPAPIANGRVRSETQGIVGLMSLNDDSVATVQPENRDQFAGEYVSPVKVALDEPVSTFSIDVDTASYSVMRRSLLNGHLPAADSVRTEEMINYFDYNYASPQTAEQPFAPQATLMPTPWNDDTLLLHIGIQGYEIPLDDRPAVNLVFLIDTSGSMNAPDKLPLLIQSFRLLLSTLNDQDTVAIVTYAGSAGMALEPTSANERNKILSALTNLSANGSTAGQAGLTQAYALAEDMMDDGETSRVILATDGDFNVGMSSTEAMQGFIEGKRESGVYLSILGFGQGNYNDALMQTLAQNGNGTAAYIDTLAEAQKVLVDQIGGALFTIAQDVKIQVEFNPSEVAEYRLIGYETRALAREDFNNDAVDAGDIGAGTQVTALYEITPVGSPAISVDPLRYSEAQPLPEGNGELAFLKLRYKLPGESTSNLITTPVQEDDVLDLSEDVIFSTAVASFGQLLRGDTRLGNWSYDDVLRLAQQGKGEDTFGYRAEFIRLVRLAETAQ